MPNGNWTHLLTGEQREGGKWYSENYDFFSLPLFVRENTILPIGKEETVPDYDYGDSVTLHVFNLTEKASRIVYDSQCNKIFEVTGENKGKELVFNFDVLPNNGKILLRNVSEIADVTGATQEKCEQGTLLTLTSTEIKVIL